MELEINEKYIKVGKLPVSTTLNLGDKIKLVLVDENKSFDMVCVKLEEKDNQDGSKDVIQVLKHTGSIEDIQK